MLKELLSEDLIELNVDVSNWEDAVKIGGGLLEKQGLVENRYVSAMIDTVKELGPYIVIAPGIAMPHARPESGVNKVGISIITLKNPVNFGNKENDPVKIVISLCAVDHDSHIEALSELVKLLQNDEFQALFSTDDKSKILSAVRNTQD